MKFFKLTNEKRQQIINSLKYDFDNACQKIDENTLSISLKIKPLKTEEKTVVYFTPVAFLKITELVKTNDKEVGWHGTAERYGENDYLIKDIFVYPQKVTGAHIDTDDAEYENWSCNELPIDITNQLRFHGHSHVNMGVCPSGTDNDHRKDVVSILKDDDFYVFMIVNKKGDSSFEIYDKLKNVIFESNDITYDIILEDGSMKSFLNASKDRVKEQLYTVTTFSNHKNEDKKEINVNKNVNKNTFVSKKESNYNPYGLYDDDDLYDCNPIGYDYSGYFGHPYDRYGFYD